VTVTICALFGYKRRTAFLTGISLAQLSEFSLIIVMQGKLLGHISDEIFGVTILLTIVTIMLTSYLIKYEQPIYRGMSNWLRVFERISKKNKELENIIDDHQHEVVLAGYDLTGYSIFKTLQRMKKDFVVVEYDPEIIRKLIDENVPCIYGDIGDVEILEKLKLKNVKLVISTIPHQANTLLLMKKVKEKNPHAHMIVTSDSASNALELYDLGADYVIVPHYLGGDHVSLMLEDITDDLDKLIDTKIAHIKDLHARRRHHKNKRRN
jgi:voltage-gated potassium channel Kch